MEQEILTTRPSLILALDAWIGAVVGAYALIGIGGNLAELLYMYTQIEVPKAWILLASMLPFLGAAARTMSLYCTVYYLTNQRLIRRIGVLSTRYDEIELLRVRDFIVSEPFHLRIMGLGNVTVISTDRSCPELQIKAQRHVQALRNQLRALVLARQKELGYREAEVS